MKKKDVPSVTQQGTARIICRVVATPKAAEPSGIGRDVNILTVVQDVTEEKTVNIFMSKKERRK